MDIFFVSLLVVHIAAASIWVGGAVMLELVFEPTIGIISKVQAGLVSRHVENRFTYMSWTALIVMSATGIIMSLIQGTFNFSLFSGIGLILLACIALTGVAMTDGLLITYYFTPRLQSVIYSESNLRILVRMVIRLNNLIGLSVVILMVLFTELLRAYA